MTRSLLIDPIAVTRQQRLRIAPIDVNRYQATLADERNCYADDRLVAVFRDMVLIREIETMLHAIKRGEAYHGVSYAYGGPAHLSIGQEAAAVGQALALTRDDHCFGSHRSHGEIIAKGMAAIDESDEAELKTLMASYGEGRIVGVVEEHVSTADVRAKAQTFFVYGFLAEIFGRSTGFNRGVGGSMHAFFTPFGIYPNNAIVGGSATIAAGSALFRRVQGRPGITVANIGDGSSGCGTVWEAMNFASMAQFSSLFDDKHRGGLPVVFFFVNNFYAMGGQTIGETMGFDRLSRIGAGVNAHNMHAETIDGTSPLAVADAVTRARDHIEAGEGPVLIDCQCYRYSGHSPSDASSYRTREEVDLWRTYDAIPAYEAALVREGLLTEPGARDVEAWASGLVETVTRLAVDPVISPSLSIDEIERLTFSNHADDAPLRAGETLVPIEETSRFQQLQRRARGSKDGTGGAIQLRDAIFEAIAARAVADDRLVVYGEENRDWGGAFGVYRGLTELLPYRRLFNAPLSEAAIVGTAVGYAMEGGRAVIDIMYADFLGRAGDEILNQLAKWTAMSGGTMRLPVVLRVSVGSAYGAQHSQDWTGLVAHVPGLKVVYPATPYDAKGIMAAALEQDDPVVFFESQRLYSIVEYLRPDGVPARHYTVPIGEPRVVRHGDDVTLLTVGPTLYPGMQAAAELSARYGVETEVIDARSMVPLDLDPIIESARRTGRVLLVSDATRRGSWLHTVASDVQLAAFDHLDAPVVVIGAPDCITPPSHLEQAYFPSAQRILDELRRSVMSLAEPI